MAQAREDFWTEDPSVLLNNLKFIPTKCMTHNEKMNALMRLVIVATVILYAMEYDYWLYFGLITGFIVVTVHSYTRKRIEYSSKIAPKRVLRENYVSPLTSSANSSGALTYSAPVYAEEWQINPQVYESRETLVRRTPENIEIIEDAFPGTRSYAPRPYGQYITELNPNIDGVMPCDSNVMSRTRTRNGGGYGSTPAREYVNSNFVKNAVAFRDNMTSIYKKKLNRRYLCNSENDQFSPYYSDGLRN